MKMVKDLSSIQADLLSKHDLAMRDLDAYGAFLEAWQMLIDENHTDGTHNQGSFADFECYASHAVQSFLETGYNFSGGDLGQFECGAALVNSAGIIKDLNIFASRAGNLIPGLSLSGCGIKFAHDNNIELLLDKKARDSPSTFQLIQAECSPADMSFVLVISKVDTAVEQEDLFLVLFIVPPDMQSTADLMASKFSFTSAESEVAKAFLEGVALRDIAIRRRRSYVTIRNQFQRILEKSNCASQTELFRLSFSLTSLIGNSVEVWQSKNRTIDKTMTLPRANGRVVELTLSGAENGQPVLSLPSLFGHGVTPALDERLRDQGILLINLMRPGFGGTSVPVDGQGLDDCIASDVRAILDSLEIERCPCIARASAARPFYNLLVNLPDRICRGVLANGMIPREYIEGKSIVSRWTTALMSASVVSYPIAKLILGTGNSLFMRSRGSSFLQRMYQNSRSDCTILGDPAVVASIRSGVHKITQQGLGAGVQEMVDAFQNWSEELQDLETPVTLYHGTYDPNVPISGVREFAKDNAHYLTLVEEEEGGGLLFHSHAETFINLALQGNEEQLPI